MLNRVENIALSHHARNDLKYSDKDHATSSRLIKKESGSDSIIYSSALIYLAQIQWELKKVDINKPEEIIIEFACDGFVFKVKFNSKEAISNKVIYSIINSAFPSRESAKYNVTFTFTYSINNLVSNKQTSLNALRTFFTKLNELDWSFEEELKKKYYFELINGIEKVLHTELSEVHSKLLVFLENLMSRSFKGLYSGDDDLKGAEAILIQNIKKEKS